MTDLTHAQVFRLIWIDSALSTVGIVNRGDIVAACGVTVATASLDLRTYQERWPSLIEYDFSKKRFFRPVGAGSAFPQAARSAARALSEWVEDYFEQKPAPAAAQALSDA